MISEQPVSQVNGWCTIFSFRTNLDGSDWKGFWALSYALSATPSHFSQLNSMTSELGPWNRSPCQDTTAKKVLCHSRKTSNWPGHDDRNDESYSNMIERCMLHARSVLISGSGVTRTMQFLKRRLGRKRSCEEELIVQCKATKRPKSKGRQS